MLLRGGPAGTPGGNTAMLAMGILLAGAMGTTGASMVLIHPLLRANAHRRAKMHLVLFLIVLVANAAGALTPLGNPPLYLGLLRGVPFFWPPASAAALLAVGRVAPGGVLGVGPAASGDRPAGAARDACGCAAGAMSR